jgi:hypothetical protein
MQQQSCGYRQGIVSGPESGDDSVVGITTLGADYTLVLSLKLIWREMFEEGSA